jgi:hypothetical protein
MAAKILDRALPLPVLELGRFLEYSRSVIPRPFELSVYVDNAHLDHVGDSSRLRWLLLAPHIRHDHSSIGTNSHLRSVCLTDPHPLDESERAGEPGDGGTDIGVDEHRYDGRRRYRTIAQHPTQANGPRYRDIKDSGGPERVGDLGFAASGVGHVRWWPALGSLPQKMELILTQAEASWAMRRTYRSR